MVSSDNNPTLYKMLKINKWLKLDIFYHQGKLSNFFYKWSRMNHYAEISIKYCSLPLEVNSTYIIMLLLLTIPDWFLDNFIWYIGVTDCCFSVHFWYNAWWNIRVVINHLDVTRDDLFVQCGPNPDFG